MPLFGRLASTDVENVLRSLVASSKAGLRALARNLMHDHRVDERRDRVLRELFQAPLTEDVLEDAVQGYRDRRVRFTASPDFIDDDYNGPNILAGKALGGHEVSKDLELGRIVDLSAMGAFYEAAREAYCRTHEPRLAPFATVPDGDSLHIKRWVDVHMEGEPQRRAFIAAVLANLWPSRDAAPYEPCWATTWDVLEAVADEPASRWAEVVGVPAPEGNWLILIRYRVRDVGTLVRPTQLDSGWNALHFPSPPIEPVAAGGHPMDLGVDGCPAALLPEFIHQQIAHPIEHWEAAGSRAQKVPSGIRLVERDIVYQRQRHWSLLVQRHGPVIGAWMPRPE